MKKTIYLVWLAIIIAGSACSDMFDNVKEFAPKETVYSGKFDYANATIGYERVEIDLLEAGRIPTSAVQLGKARKTRIEYDDKVIIIDSVRSWLNITGLKQSRLYKFKIYTLDEHGNKSVPVEVSTIPFTIDDVQALTVATPRIISSPWVAGIDWPDGLTSTMFDFIGLSYSYLDKNGKTVTGSYTGDSVKFQIENQQAEANVNVSVKYKIIPRKDGKPILDTLEIEKPFTFSLPTVEKYKETLVSRQIRSVDDKGGIYIIWEPVNNETLKRTIIQYDDYSNPDNPQKKTVTVQNQDTTTKVPGIKMGKENFITIQSVFLPYGSDEEVTANPKKYNLPSTLRLDRTDWTVPYVSSSDGDPLPDALFDDNLYGTLWHSGYKNGPSSLPHILVIDMKNPVNICQIDVTRRNWDLPDTKTVECYAGNSEDPEDAGWTLIGKNAFPDDNKLNADLTIQIPDRNLSSRYLKLVLPDSFRGTACNIGEVIVYARY
ncbi:MAG: DUF4998 domain-containing protein [Dysgonamonadaceae bacterium]|jgi:hypothetical protein|nr:DUF4998 domain-containing protein [Dysgonamonadaceae bacterium]